MFGEYYDVSPTGSPKVDAYKSLYASLGEQNLAENMYDELCQQQGYKCNYYSVVYNNIDEIFGEHRYSLYPESKSIVLKLYSPDFHDLIPRTILAKTQYTNDDKVQFHIAKNRFRFESNKQISDEALIPKGGDIIAVEMTGDLFKVVAPEGEYQYYDKGSAYAWQLICKRYDPAGEQFDEGSQFDNIKDVDNLGIFDTNIFTGDNLRLEQETDILDNSEGTIYGGCRVV